MQEYECVSALRRCLHQAGARMEMRAGKMEQARKLLDHALKEAPQKAKAQVLVEYAQLEEICGQLDSASDLLGTGRGGAQHNSLPRSKGRMDGRWRLIRAAAALKLRAGQRGCAVRIVAEALQAEGGNGRLWALLVQLLQPKGLELRAFRLGLQCAPKSGELWCEGARLRLNPQSRYFELACS